MHLQSFDFSSENTSNIEEQSPRKPNETLTLNDYESINHKLNRGKIEVILSKKHLHIVSSIERLQIEGKVKKSNNKKGVTFKDYPLSNIIMNKITEN